MSSLSSTILGSTRWCSTRWSSVLPSTLLLCAFAWTSSALAQSQTVLTPSTATPCADPARLQPGLSTDCIIRTRDGSLRAFDVLVPDTARAGSAFVFDFHAAGSDKTAQRALSGFAELAAQEGFVVVWPQGVGNSFNTMGPCCGRANAQNVDDVGFAREIFRVVSGSVSLDARRVFATGFSNGAGMASTLACDAADLVSAVAPISFSLSVNVPTFENAVDRCRPGEGVAVAEFRGTADRLVPFRSGGLTLSALESSRAYAEIMQCDSAAEQISIAQNTTCTQFSDCRDGASVAMCAVENGAHLLYPDVQGPGIAPLVWDFFQRGRFSELKVDDTTLADEAVPQLPGTRRTGFAPGGEAVVPVRDDPEDAPVVIPRRSAPPTPDLPLGPSSGFALIPGSAVNPTTICFGILLPECMPTGLR